MSSRLASLLLLALLGACPGGDDPGEATRPPAGLDSPRPTPSSSALESAATSATTAAPMTGLPLPSTAPPSTLPAPVRELVVPPLRLARVATLDGPLALAVRADDPALYVAEKGGRVRAVRDGRVVEPPVLDVSGEVTSGFEQGLLGLTFSPDGQRLYVNFTDRQGDTRLQEFTVAGGRADPATRRELLHVEQPFANHNGGQLTFGPDGLLYVGLGDGGSGGDPEGNAQNLGVVLGKILRIDPRPGPSGPYTVPSDNPFVGRSGARPEVWAYGLRNPWRFSFDRSTGDLWIGDVGQNQYEEVDFAPPAVSRGANFGWDRLEGRHSFEGEPPAGHVPPIHEYRLVGVNCAVTGGHVYRGSRIPGLVGTYLFADFCTGDVMGLRQERGEARDVRSLGMTAPQIASFGEDLAGELYVLSLEGGLYRVEPG